MNTQSTTIPSSSSDDTTTSGSSSNTNTPPSTPSTPTSSSFASLSDTFKRLIKSKETTTLLDLIHFIEHNHQLNTLLETNSIHMNEQQIDTIKLNVLKRMIHLLNVHYVNYYYKNYNISGVNTNNTTISSGHLHAHVNREFVYLFKSTMRVLNRHFLPLTREAATINATETSATNTTTTTTTTTEATMSDDSHHQKRTHSMTLIPSQKFTQLIVHDLLKYYEQHDLLNEYVLTLLLLRSYTPLWSTDSSQDASSIFYSSFTQVLMNTTKANVKIQITNDAWYAIFKQIHTHNKQYLFGLVDTLERAFKRSKQTMGPIIAQIYNVCCNDPEMVKSQVLNNILLEMLKLKNEVVLVESGISMVISQTLKSTCDNNDQLVIKRSEVQLLDTKIKQAMFERIYFQLMLLNKNIDQKHSMINLKTSISIFDKTFNQIGTGLKSEKNIQELVSFLFDYLNTTPAMTENCQSLIHVTNILSELFTDFNIKQIGDVTYLNSNQHILTTFQKIFKLEGDEIVEVKKTLLSFISTVCVELLNSDMPSPNIETFCLDVITLSEKKKSLRSLALYCFALLTDGVLILNKESIVKSLQQNLKKILSFLFTKETLEYLTQPKDYHALAHVVKNVLFATQHGDYFVRLSKMISSSLSNAIKSDLYYMCCVALSNAMDHHHPQRMLAEHILNQYSPLDSNHNLMEQILMEGFYGRLLIELEDQMTIQQQQRLRHELEDQDTHHRPSSIYTHSSLKFAIDTLRDCFIKKHFKIEKENLYKLFIMMNHPAIVENPHAMVHNERYKTLLLSPLTRVMVVSGSMSSNNDIQHEHHIDNLAEYLINEIDGENSNTRSHMRTAIAYSLISLLLWKHAKFSHKIFEIIAKRLTPHVHYLFESNEFDSTDFIIFNRKSEEPYHDLDSEVNKHPIYRQGSSSTELLTEKQLVKYYRYHLTDKEWEVIQNKEKTIKKNLQESRKQFVKETMIKKENALRQIIEKQVQKIEYLLDILYQMTQLTVGDKMSVDIVTKGGASDDQQVEQIETHHQTHFLKFPWSLVLFKVTDLIDKYQYFEKLSCQAFTILKCVNRNTLTHLDFASQNIKTSTQRKNTISNEALADMLAVATFRIRNRLHEVMSIPLLNHGTSSGDDENHDSESGTTSNTTTTTSSSSSTSNTTSSSSSTLNHHYEPITRFIPGFDNNLLFGDYIIHKIRLQFPNMLEAEEFTSVLPFLEAMLNRQSVISKPEHRFDTSTLTTCMSILSAHAGKTDLSNITRNKVMQICVNEVLPFIPHLNKQAFNSIMAMAPYLVDEFSPLMTSIIYSEMENVRLCCLKTLIQYLTRGDLKKLSPSQSQDIKFTLFYAQYDTCEEASKIAKNAIHERKLYSYHSSSDVDDLVERCLPLICCEEDVPSSTASLSLTTSLTTASPSLTSHSIHHPPTYYSRNNSCLALTGALKELTQNDKNKRNNIIHHILMKLTKVFEEKQQKIQKESDFDPLITIAWLFQEISPFTYTKNDLTTLFDFVVQVGFKQLETRFEEQYQTLLDEMVNVGLALVYNHGKESTSVLIDLFEKYLSQLQKTSNDFATATVVVWYGSVAKHFDTSASSVPKIKKAIDQLIDALSIPSNSVQKSISEALSPLIASIYQKEKDYIFNELVNKRLLSFLLYGIKDEKKPLQKGLSSNTAPTTTTTTYGMKRGFAWGLAGVMYGCGLHDTYQYVISPLNQFLSSSKADKKGKEGCMLAFECLSHRFLNLFEPYIVEVMPSILNHALSDPSKEVRMAGEQAVSVILSQLTPYGVIQLLPTVIQPTSNDNWRQKAANIRLLGHMAYCAPRQLSAYLPTIIGILKEAVNETHPDIIEASKRSLERVGGASRSPEISKQVPLLLEALTNPEQKTIDKVLESLLFTRFTHSIDSASLALLMPVLTRALNERYTDIKKKACQIIGSISALIIDPKRDLFPYMESLIPILKNILMDPSPQVRASSAKAIGQLCKSVGEDNVSGVMSWLHEKLKQQGSEYITERSGAAQALCEIIAAQGVSRLQKSLPFLLSQIEGDQVEEGYMQVFVYLPALMKAQFEPFLELCLPKILNALSHPKENIRETALQSSRVIVELFTDSAMNILVPALREGLESEEWRTRYNCLVLLTDLLTRMTVLYGNSEEMQKVEENPIQLSVVERVLSSDMVAHVISLTFIALSDINLKSVANKLWKDMVPNTPSTLKNYLPQIIESMIKHLNMSEDQRFIAGKALGELVLKLGERVLSELIPMLQSQLLDPDSNPEKRQGVILGVTELMSAASDKHLQAYSSKLIAIVKRGICDPDSSVRDSSSNAFDVLCSIMGERCVKDILSQLLNDLEKADKPQIVEIASNGMQQLVRVRPQHVLPKLIPALLHTGSSAGATSGGSSGSSGASSSFLLTDTQLSTLGNVCDSVYEYDHIEEMSEFILPMVEKLMNQLAQSPYIESVTNVDEESILILRTISKVLQCLDVIEGYTIFELIGNQFASNDAKIRRSACLFMQMIFNKLLNEETITEDFITYGLLPIYEHLITAFNDPDDGVVQCAWHAVEKLINKCLSKEVHYNDFIQPTREYIHKLTQVSNITGEIIPIDLPAFNKLTRGVEPILNLYIHGLLFGKTPEARENSALGIGDVIQMTQAKQLSPYVIKITGPLIRVAGDRFPWQVKAAILQTCSSLMDKGSLMLKPFLPQLQATFIKGLQDSSASILRKYSEQSIPKLIDLGCRVDALVSALNVALKANALAGKGGGSVNDFVISITRTLNHILLQTCDQQKTKGVPYDQCMDTLRKILGLSDSQECLNSLLTKQSIQQDSDRILDICAQCLSICCRGIYLQSNKNDHNSIVMEFMRGVMAQNDNLYVTFVVMSHWAVDPILSEFTLSVVKEKIEKASNDPTIQSKVAISLSKAATRLIMQNLSHVSLSNDMLNVLKNQFDKAYLNATANTNALRYELAKCIKKLVKAYREMCCDYSKMFDFVEVLMQVGIKDKFPPAKLCNERTLFYMLGFADNDSSRVITEYCSHKKLSAKESKMVEDFGIKVLSKLSMEDSDLERDEDEEEKYYE